MNKKIWLTLIASTMLVSGLPGRAAAQAVAQSDESQTTGPEQAQRAILAGRYAHNPRLLQWLSQKAAAATNRGLQSSEPQAESEADAAKPPVYRVLYTFTGGADGANPWDFNGLIRDEEGNLYGTTRGGGDVSGSCGGCGVVFKLDPWGKETVLYSFTGGADGANPYAGLILDEEGNLYGTTVNGGTGTCSLFGIETGCGVVFKLDPSGTETVLYNFTGGTDGSAPYAGLVRDREGNLYGTADSGGDTSGFCGGLLPPGCGVVFKLTRDGKFTVLYTFTGTDGAIPNGVIRDEEGNLYGTTLYGGDITSSSCFGDGCGVVFKLDRTTRKETVLYSFTGGTDGGLPNDVIRDEEGKLYGTTFLGGDVNGGTSSVCGTFGCGTVFKLNRDGKETVLYSFMGGADGSDPQAGVIRDRKGNLYGTTNRGPTVGPGGGGVAFRLDRAGKETVLYTFTGEADGGYLVAPLLRDEEGNLYGTTYFGGDLTSPYCGSGCGVVFKLKLYDDRDGEEGSGALPPQNN